MEYSPSPTQNPSPTTTPPKKRLKRCEYKGCEKTSNECNIINHGCPDHHEYLKDKKRNKGSQIMPKRRQIFANILILHRVLL